MRVVVDIEEDTPIKGDTVARLSLQGVTGLLTINLEPRDPASMPPPPDREPQISRDPVRSSRSSTCLSPACPTSSRKSGEALNRINAILSDDNIAAVSKSFEYTEKATADLPMAIEEARAMFLELRAAASEIEAAAKGLHEFAGPGGADLKAAAARMREVADNAARSAARLDRWSSRTMRATSTASPAKASRSSSSWCARRARPCRAIDALTESLERDPSRLIYRPAPAGVEIPP